MSGRDDGGPAFPQYDFNPHTGQQYCSGPGMSMRDYFAAKAMAALITSDCWNIEAAGEDEAQPEHIAVEAYVLADAMLEARQA